MTGKLQVTVLSPEVELLDKPCDFVALPALEGELGILPRHAPLVARLGAGEMRITAGGVVERHYVSGGYLQVRDNAVYVLTELAIDGKSLDPAAIEQELEAARALPGASQEQQEARQAAIARAKSKLAIHKRSTH